ncbi:hypothetical protein GCM10010909_21380 [Acidocella aquatica]|uniref:Uncharacterized protein n=1 Tax=Acidocella aquatica TaxID=1922313 RepID=A0ABQ6A6Y2_9PROT|nr:SDR family oxidoreductase [Acidocella aquatica]GLR67457.1 hypothetical protein GCM10010909_21380 [Acidocella aquatica]
MESFKEHAAIVTGAAGGMGSAIARAFAKQGWPLVLSDLHEEPLAALGTKKIGALVHAAGVSPSMTNGKRVFAINFTATKTLVEALLPNMALGGAAVLIASNSGNFLRGQLSTEP